MADILQMTLEMHFLEGELMYIFCIPIVILVQFVPVDTFDDSHQWFMQ